MAPSGSATGTWVHRGAVYDSVDEAARLAVAALAEARTRGRSPLLATLRPEVEPAVREGLGAMADDVEFLPSRPRAGQSAEQVVHDHLARGRARPWHPCTVAAIDPVADPWGTVCLETEVLATSRLAELDEEHICLYPRAEPFTRVAEVSHPRLVDDHGVHPNPAYRSTSELLTEEPALAHLDPEVVVRDVVPHLDPDLRGWLAGQARAAGLDADVVEQVVLATHEALRAGAESRARRAGAPATGGGTLGVARADGDGLPSTRLYLHRLGPDHPGALAIDVDAAWLSELRADQLPTDEVVKGVWIANAGCPDVTVSVHPVSADHSRVRVVAPARPTTPRPGN